ncbi:MAG: ABC transporter ATP-binding protein [Gammaproteobacteria bacterium]|nr:ABC transporter ATP-binding protein [Gammaproteobacteria bacterium]
MSKTTLIKASGIQRYYGNSLAVNNLNFELHVGDILGFLGPNGAGKSTTMQIISGTLAPDAGQIEINGYDLIEQSTLAKQQLGYLPEQPPLYKELTVDEYLSYCARLRNIDKPSLPAALDKAKQRCGLSAVGRQLISSLSKGYQQRVGIAQAIIHNPAVIILDEPTVGLDPIQIQEIRQLILELGQHHGIILSTHILPEVQAVCNRVQIIRQGELVFNSEMASIDKSRHSQQFDLAFKAPVDDALLNSIDSLTLDKLSETSYCIELPDNESEADAALQQLLTVCCQQNWRLQQLTPRSRSLEQIFIELTTHDNSSGNDTAALAEKETSE